jgi:methionyl aminopeptidase
MGVESHRPTCVPPLSLISVDPRHSQHDLIGIEVKDAAGIAGMRAACELASYIRAYAGSCVIVGRSTNDIDAMVHDEVCRIGSYPSPLGYARFPKSICTSVNQVVVHGIPDGRKLEEGDIINIDVSVYVKEGYHGDCSGMVSEGTHAQM